MRSLLTVLGTSLCTLSEVLKTHCRALKLGTDADIYVANNIVSGYLKCGELCVGRNMFEEMIHRDSVSYNTMVAGYVNNGELGTAWEILKAMKRCGFELDEYTFGSILKGIASENQLDPGRQMHAMILKIGHVRNVFSGSALLDMYSKCHIVEDAYKAFQSISKRNTVPWNALIACFAEMGDRGTAFWLLDCMEREDGVDLDDGTFAPLLPLLDNAEFLKLTMQIHAKIMKRGLMSCNTVCNSMITSYAECGVLEKANIVFDDSEGARDLVTWNSMVAAYLVHDKGDLAFKILIEMQAHGFQPDIYTYTSVISACPTEEHNYGGKSLHGAVIKRGLEQLTPIANALMSMYLRSDVRSMDKALSIFESLRSKDRVSWNSILTGFSQTGLSEVAVSCFVHMRSATVDIDHYAFSAVLKSCSDLAVLRLGQQVHALAFREGFECNDFVASALIFMYSKCGIIEDARKSFEETSRDTSITWNSIIFGYAQHGQGKAALDLFFLMREKRVKLDHVTFVAVLTACSHMGFVEEGRQFLKSMESDYGIPPRMEHYACAVDLYGRAGHLEEALALVEEMPFKPDATIWKTFLGACRICGSIELASQVASYLLEMEPEEHCTYVLLSNMYGHLSKWDERANVKRLMKERGVKKVPGWSWIEVQNEVHVFNAEDRSHSEYGHIYFLLEGMMEEIRRIDRVDEMALQEEDFGSVGGCMM